MKAVILAAGEGKRLRPFTYTTPKVMLQVAGKPILEHIIEEVKKAGITEMIVVVKYLKEKIIEYFKNKDLGVSIEFIEQGKEYGTGAALLCVKEKLDETFLVVAGDSLIDSSIVKKVIEEHEQGVTFAVKQVENPEDYGVVEIDNEIVVGFEEKPKNAKTNLINISIYCFEKNIFEKIEQINSSKRGEYELTDLLIGAKAVNVNGFWMDIAYPWNLFDANEYLLSHMEMNTEQGDVENSTIKGKVILEKGAKVVDSFIEGNVYVGENSIIGPNAYIRGNCSIGKNCSVGGGTTLKNSILFDNVNAKHLAYIGDSVIGNRVNFGSGTQIANYRFDASPIKVLTEKGWVDSGKNKLGCFVGDDSKFGVLSCTMPGKLIGNNCWISSGVIVNKNLEANKRIFVKQEHTFMEQGD